LARGIVIALIIVIVLGAFGLYAIQRGPSLLLRPPSEMRIAFVSDRSGQRDLWTMSADGSDVRPVTSDEADDQSPAWSPDGREVASVSDREGGTYQVFLSAWNGAYTRRMTISAGSKDMPAWKPDGKELAFIASGKVMTISRYGREETQFLPSPDVPDVGQFSGGPAETYVSATWSAEGKSLLVVREMDAGISAFIADPDRELVGVTMARSLDVTWAPAENKVAAAFTDRRGQNGLLIADMAQVEVTELFVTEGDSTGPAKPAWSPDGKRIVFEMWTIRNSTPDRCVGIYAVDVRGGSPRRLVEGDARAPSWSPDGKWLLYTLAGRNEDRDIWRINADGAGAVNLTRGEGDNHSPAWSRLFAGSPRSVL